MPRETLKERRAGAYEGGIRVSVDQIEPPATIQHCRGL